MYVYAFVHFTVDAARATHSRARQGDFIFVQLIQIKYRLYRMSRL